MNSKLFSIEDASELSGLSIDVIKKFIRLKAIITVKNDHKNIKINSYGLTRLKIVSELLDKGFSKSEIMNELDNK